MGLINPNQLNQIRKAFKSVTDTFSTIPAKISITGKSLDYYNEDRNDTGQTIITVKCLAVYESSGTGALDKIMRNETFSFNEGYALFNVEDLRAAGLISVTGTALIQATKDSIEVGGEKFKIMGINPLGYLINDYSLVKIHLERQVKQK